MKTTRENEIETLYAETKLEKTVLQKAHNWDELIDFVSSRILEDGDSLAVEIDTFLKARKYDQIQAAGKELLKKEEYKNEAVKQFWRELCYIL